MMAFFAAALAGTPALPTAGDTLSSRLLANELARALYAYDRATIGRDTRGLAALVTDDYMLVNSDASVQDKGSYLADFAVPGFKIEPYRMQHPFSRIYADTALTGGTFQLRWTQDGQRHTRRLRAAHLWVRQHGRWRIAYTQLTRVGQ